MIITNRAAAPSYSTDAVARSVRTFIAPSARLAAGAAPGAGRVREDDLARLYPNVFAREHRAASAAGRARSAAARLTATGGSIAAALILVLHR